MQRGRGRDQVRAGRDRPGISRRMSISRSLNDHSASGDIARLHCFALRNSIAMRHCFPRRYCFALRNLRLEQLVFCGYQHQRGKQHEEPDIAHKECVILHRQQEEDEDIQHRKQAADEEHHPFLVKQ